MTIMIVCNCEHDFQDEMYGKQRRVANTNGKGCTCTVCGKTTVGKGAVDEKAKAPVGKKKK